MRSYMKIRNEAVEQLRALKRALNKYEREADESYYFADKLSDIHNSINLLRTALRQADYYHAQSKYSKAIDILERALERAFDDPFLHV